MALWHQIGRSGIQRLVLYSNSPNFLRGSLRFFAIPAHVKAKQDAAKKEADSSGPRLNAAIAAAYVRLVTDEGHSVLSMREALERARSLNLDLVEVQRAANPPVCKIMDFHKEKFKQEVKEKDRAKSKSEPKLRTGENKEVRFNAKTEPKDLKIKSDTITRLMERGYRVKCTVLPVGKGEEDLMGLLTRILALIEDVAVVESGPHVVDSKQAYIIVRHAKFATKKSGKKAIKPLEAVSKIHTSVPNAPEAVKSSMEAQSNERQATERSSDTGFSKPSQQKPFVQSKPELSPSFVATNRYAKPSEPMNSHQNRERMSQQATRNGSDPRAQFDPKQRQFNNTPNIARPPTFDRRNSGPPPGPSRSVPSSDQRNPREATVPQARPPSFFSAAKPAVPGDQSSIKNTVNKPNSSSNTSASSTRSGGALNATKPAGLGDQNKSSKDTTPDKPAKSYGIFSKPKASV